MGFKGSRVQIPASRPINSKKINDFRPGYSRAVSFLGRASSKSSSKFSGHSVESRCLAPWFAVTGLRVTPEKAVVPLPKSHPFPRIRDSQRDQIGVEFWRRSRDRADAWSWTPP
ncbi:MAG: hypothetical protein DIJKHBIC_04369 [Thermoanaerobaculia bacterium]|nr:hypothetical protein [Thermoanaerobaculia bacterium]